MPIPKILSGDSVLHQMTEVDLPPQVFLPFKGFNELGNVGFDVFVGGAPPIQEQSKLDFKVGIERVMVSCYRVQKNYKVALG
jgi:hypothetical protein